MMRLPWFLALAIVLHLILPPFPPPERDNVGHPPVGHPDAHRYMPRPGARCASSASMTLEATP